MVWSGSSGTGIPHVRREAGREMDRSVRSDESAELSEASSAAAREGGCKAARSKCGVRKNGVILPGSVRACAESSVTYAKAVATAT